MTVISNIKSEKAQEIVNVGLQKAAETLSFFMKEEIKLDQMEYCFDPPCDLKNVAGGKGTNAHVLITNVIGEINGVCCLVFNEHEADRLRSAALPPEVTENAEMMLEMKDGILLEVDNIISASVITQFSNILKIKIHGGVPSLKKLNETQLDKFLKDLLENNLYIINFNTHFVSSRLDFSPQFLWFFDESFANSIKDFSVGKMN